MSNDHAVVEWAQGYRRSMEGGMAIENPYYEAGDLEQIIAWDDGFEAAAAARRAQWVVRSKRWLAAAAFIAACGVVAAVTLGGK